MPHTFATKKDEKPKEWWFRTATFIVIAFFAVITIRLWFLQVQLTGQFTREAEQNRVKTLYIAAPRGDILDRNGAKIVTTRPFFNIVWAREDTPDADLVLDNISRFLHLEKSYFLDRIRQSVDSPRHIPVTLFEGIDWATLARVESHQLDLPGIRVVARPMRHFLSPTSASHLLGYLGEISKKELKQKKSQEYRLGDLIGKSGIEKAYESYLRGEHGIQYLEVDARGYQKRKLKKKRPLPGHDIVLTLDNGLQLAAEEAMGEMAGAVVALEPTSGRILAMVSTPTLDLNQMSGKIPQDYWNQLLNNEKKPLLNKPIQGIYPPGSVYKIVGAAAILAEQIFTPDTEVFCPGFLSFGGNRYGCWKKEGHGMVNLKKAIAESCDVYFYQAGLKLGVDRLAQYAQAFGFGQETGIELAHEKTGVNPNKKWKQQHRHNPWFPGETLPVAIGQGFVAVTPLQIARMTMAVANGGTLYRPQYIEKIITPDNHLLKSFAPDVQGELPALVKKDLSLIRTGLEEVVNGPHGTARAVRLPGITVAGKTGTAQVTSLARHKGMNAQDIPYEERDHAWFTAYAPANRPQIVVTVLVEHGGHGGATAGPVARKVLETFFLQKGQLLQDETGKVRSHEN